jgi:hypothetical protein
MSCLILSAAAAPGSQATPRSLRPSSSVLPSKNDLPLRWAHRQHGRDLALVAPFLGPSGDLAASEVGEGGVVAHHPCTRTARIIATSPMFRISAR